MAVLHYDIFPGKAVAAFSSDSSLDFLKGDPKEPQQFKLSLAQRALLNAEGVGSEVVFPKQVHGDVIWEVIGKDVGQAGIYEADAVVTAVPGVAVAIRTADCLPLLLYVPASAAGAARGGVVAAVHAGWKSTHLDIAAKTVALLKQKYGVAPKDILAAIGPCIRPQSYSVGEEFKSFFPKDVIAQKGCWYFDIAAANKRQLLSAGVPGGNIFDCGLDTFADRAWHSFRRDAEASGRMIHAVRLKG
ncbi:MAG: polyphenol oxidase family protein [Candidatus Omnitrophica bacterium]|nr:polyphenol oxidase family protein [Candidatus Omnitrophota bacterium]